MEIKCSCRKLKQVRENTVYGHFLLLFLQQDYGWALGLRINVEKLSYVTACCLVKVDSVFQP
jgi:hypothetical protein